MKKLIGLFAALTIVFSASAQIVSIGHAGSSLTAYTNGGSNDSIYFYCDGGLGTLSAEVTTGTAPYDYAWFIFNSTTNSFDPFLTESDVATSTITDLQPGAYKLSVSDANDNIVACDKAWIAQVLTNPSVNVNDIAEGCGSFQLGGQVTYGTATPYYNLPPDELIIDAETAITICFTGTHTWVSDLAFYIVGPSTCGSPTILLSPNPGAIGQGTVCNSGDNITNLCFTTEPAGNLNVCSPAPASLSGTYSSYGPSSTPINWAPLIGCSANASGWKVQIYDCIGGDVGTLTDATLTFVDVDLCGQPLTVTYSTPAGYSSAITDNSCSAGTASVFTVPTTSTSAIPYSNGFIWSASPAVTIPGASTQLAPTVSPTQNTTFTLSLTGNGPKGWCGGSNTDSEIRNLLVPEMPTIDPVNSFYCLFDAPFQLTASPSGGTFTGVGVNASGLFTPANAGVGTKIITYTVNIGGCVVSATLNINVWPTANASIIDPIPICLNGGIVELNATPAGGVWSGSGVIDITNGVFDPSLVGAGNFEITYTVPNQCLNTDNTTIIVSDVQSVTIDSPVNSFYCLFDADIQLMASPAGGSFSGSGVDQFGLFSPSVAGAGTHVITYSIDEGCLATSTVELNVFPTANASIIDQELICLDGTTVDLSASPDGGIWSGAGIIDTENGIFDPAIVGVGEFNVSYTVPNQCLNTDVSSLTISELPLVNLINPGLVCVESSDIILGTDYPGGVWSGVGITDPLLGIFDATVVGVGFSEVIYSVDNGCPASFDLDIEVVETLDATIIDIDPLCVSNAAIQLLSTYEGGVWSGQGVSPSGLFTPSVAGVGDAEITYTIDGGCSSQDNTVISVIDVPTFSFLNDGSFCIDGSEELLTTTLSGGAWSGTGITDSAMGLFSPATSGVGTFTVTYAVDGLCPVSQDQTITVHALPNVNAGTDTEICAGGSTSISASGATSYQWTATGFTNDNQSATVQPNVTTTYTVIGTDDFGCQDTDNVVVTVNSLPIVTASTTGAVCEEECAVLSASGLAAYTWTPAATLTGANTNSPTACPDATTTYTVSGVDANGCSGSAQVTQVVTQINVAISASPVEGFAPLDVNFFVSSNADDFDWTFGNGATANTNSSTETPTIFYESEGFYTVTVTANLDGCSESDEMEVIVYNFSTIKIPNVVTTNNDGLNDEYRVQGNWIEDFNMQIYNRFGALVGELKDIDEVAPNGFDFDDSFDTWNPGENSDGTYFFHYKAVGYDGKVYENTGSITVLSVK
jgi:hypothetical protein